MTRVPSLNPALLLGFDQLEARLDRLSKAASDGYPPYNIERTGESSLRVSLAVAGFTQADLEITQDANDLTVRGRQPPTSEDRVFLHRGIAARQFTRVFILADGVQVARAHLDHGLLHIDLTQPEPESRVQRIDIQ